MDACGPCVLQAPNETIKMRALIVEDEPTLRAQLVSTLRDNGFAIDEAADGDEGLYLAQNMPIDLAIVDLGLPGKDGLSMIKQIYGRAIGAAASSATPHRRLE